MRTLYRLPAFGCFAFAALSAVALSTAKGADSKPKFASKIVTSQTPGHAVDVDADISGAKHLYLVVTDADDGIGADWADWAEPRLIGPSGEVKLSDLKWKSANSGFG